MTCRQPTARVVPDPAYAWEMAVVRPGRESDLDGINEIHAHYAVDTHVSFDERSFTVDERGRWFEEFLQPGPCQLVVAEDDGVIGYAHSRRWRPKRGYSQTVETTILLRPGREGAGIGTRLYERLLSDLATRGVHGAYAVIALPNPGSIRFHAGFGFRSVGVLREVGYAQGRWVDTELMELRIAH